MGWIGYYVLAYRTLLFLIQTYPYSLTNSNLLYLIIFLSFHSQHYDDGSGDWNGYLRKLTKKGGSDVEWWFICPDKESRKKNYPTFKEQLNLAYVSTMISPREDDNPEVTVRKRKEPDMFVGFTQQPQIPPPSAKKVKSAKKKSNKSEGGNRSTGGGGSEAFPNLKDTSGKDVTTYQGKKLAGAPAAKGKKR